MSKKFDLILPDLVTEITENYARQDTTFNQQGLPFPSRSQIINIIKELRRVFFPGYFGDETITSSNRDYFVGHLLMDIEKQLHAQIYAALAYASETSVCNQNIRDQADTICVHLFQKIPELQRMLFKDVQAAFDGDPAAHSKEEIIFSYPGLLAIFIYRIAHELYRSNVPFIPRIMTEYAHSRTGIDINAGACIGEYFFMDHGTGIVIGETTIIGNNVKIYQGVTLGALSTRMGQQLSGVKRHPTIEDNVTIYSGSSILGGETVIGENSIIGGNAFIIESVPPNTKVSIKTPELTFKGQSLNNSNWDI